MEVTYHSRKNFRFLTIGNKSDRTIKSSRLKSKDTDIKNSYNNEFPIRYNQLGNNNSNRKPTDKLRMKEQYQDFHNWKIEKLSAEKYQEYMDNDLNLHNSVEDQVFNDQNLKRNNREKKVIYNAELSKIKEYSNKNSKRSSAKRQKNPNSHIQNYEIGPVYDTNADISDEYPGGDQYLEKESRRIHTDLDLHHSPRKINLTKIQKAPKFKVKMKNHGKI